MKEKKDISYKRIASVAMIGLATVFIAAPTSTLFADKKTPKAKKNIERTSPRTVPELSKSEGELFGKVVRMKKKDREAALHLLLDSLDDDSSSFLYFLAGDLLQQNGYTVDALEYLHIAIDKYPNFYSAMRSAGIIETHFENFNEARELLQRAYELMDHPDHVIFGSLGHCHLSAGEFETAEYYYREAIKLNSDYRGWKSGLAKSLHGQSKHEEARSITKSLDSEVPK